MDIICCENYEEMSRQAAALIEAHVRLFPSSVLGLATGSTPLGTYRELIRRHLEDGLDFSEIETVNLDEYVGLGPDHPQSYRFFMDTQLFRQINIDPEMTHVPDGLAEDPEAAAADYDELVEDLGGIDLQLLGLGVNGHIGFNEPDEVFTAGTHLVNLTEETRLANSRFFESGKDVPERAISLGMEAIMKAGEIILLVSGQAKAEALRAAVLGPITPRLPASILQLHPNVTVIADSEALPWLEEVEDLEEEA